MLQSHVFTSNRVLYTIQVIPPQAKTNLGSENPYANLTKRAISATCRPATLVLPLSKICWRTRKRVTPSQSHSQSILSLTETYENGVSSKPPPCDPGFAIVQNLLTHFDNGKTSVAQKASSRIVQFCRIRESWLVQKWTIPARPQIPRRIRNYGKLRDFTNRGKVIRMRRSDTDRERPP